MKKKKLFVIPKKYSATVLSAASLGMEEKKDVKVRTYRRNGFTITKLSQPKEGKLYNALVKKPACGWHPSAMASFVFAEETEPTFIWKLVPQYFNPAVWTQTNKDLLALRVPKDRAKETHKILYTKNYWYHTVKREWYKRLHHRKK